MEFSFRLKLDKYLKNFFYFLASTLLLSFHLFAQNSSAASLEYSASLELLQTISWQESIDFYNMLTMPSNDTRSLEEKQQDPAYQKEQEEQKKFYQEIMGKLSTFYQNYYKRKDPNELAIHFNLPFDFTPTNYWNINKRRLYMRELFGSKQKKYLIAEAPNLFYAHYALGKQALQNQEYPKAALQLSQALRFRTLKMQESLLLQKEANQILTEKHPQVSFAKKYKQTQEELQNKIQEEADKRRRYWVLYDKSFSPLANSNDSQIKSRQEAETLKNQLPALQQKIKDLKNKLNQLKKEFIPLAEKYNRDSADFLELLLETMIRQDEQVRITQQSAYQMHQYTRNFSPVIPEVMPEQQDLSLQENIYEQMVQLDSQRYLAWQKLAEINTLQADYEKAIASYQQSLQILENTKDNFENSEKKLLLYATYKKLSALYLLQMKSPQAVFYLQKAYNLQEQNQELDAESKDSNLIQLARIYTNYGGNYLASFKLLTPKVKEIFLQENQNMLEVKNEEEQHSSLRTSMIILQDYARAALKIKNYNDFETACQKGINAYQNLLQQIKETYQEEHFLEEQLKNLRASQNGQNQIKYLQDYSKKNFELEQIRKQEQKLLATRNSLPMYNFYLTLAEHYQQRGNLHKAKAVLETAVRDNVEAAEARKRLLQIKDELERYGIN